MQVSNYEHELKKLRLYVWACLKYIQKLTVAASASWNKKYKRSVSQTCFFLIETVDSLPWVQQF